MGTASTMACITAALGMIPLKGASAPAVSAARLRIAEETGLNAVNAALAKRTPQSILSKDSIYNATTVLQAIGGSTNAIVHLMAIVNRHPDLHGVINLTTFDEIGSRTPMLIDLKPSGNNYMTDFHNAGGMLALLQTLRPLLHLQALTITGQTLGEVLDASIHRPCGFSRQIIRPLDDPIHPNSSLVILRGNLAPNGAIIKASASKYKELLQHRGKAVTFTSAADLAARIDCPNLAVAKDSVLVLKGIGPVGNPGMPEAGLIPIPRKLAAQGVKDMLRISDGRMSGTAGGTIVLHVSPESADPQSALGIVKDGDWICVDVKNRLIELEITDDEFKQRIRTRIIGVKTESNKAKRGYQALYERSVNQAHEGADFDFLTTKGLS